MSKAAMLVAKEDGAFRDEYEFPNSWLGAAYIWNALFDAYVPKRFEYDNWLSDEGKRVWALADDSKLTEEERIALLITFDNCIVGRNEMNTVAGALDTFSARYSAPSHLRAWSAKLRELARDETVKAVAFHHTSVSENPWWECGEHEEDEGQPYNLQTGTRHWYILERLRDDEASGV